MMSSHEEQDPLPSDIQASGGGQPLPAGENAPDIERILAELAGYSAANSASQPNAGNPAQHIPFPIHRTPHHAQSISSLSVAHSLPPTTQPQRQTATPPAQPRSPTIDPAVIFEWPQALRCVNKVSASNPLFGPTIKAMMADQDRNVKQWWEDRNNLVKTQNTRREGTRSLNEVLKGIGGKLEAERTPEQDKAELDRFDLKVYQASQQMSKAHGTELKRLGVPFFGVNARRIIANELQQTVAARDPLSQAAITETELVELQRKMIQYLEDMYKD